MTEKNMKQIAAQLPEGEKISKAYRAYEGDFRVISVDRNKTEHRYTVAFDAEFNATIQPM